MSTAPEMPSPSHKPLRVTALAGGVGGARLSHGLAQLGAALDLTVIVNVGDDFTHLGLKICPDLDTVCYTLAGLANPKTGWGRAGDSFAAISVVEQLGGPAWFHLGDLDLGLHLRRTQRLCSGERLSEVTRALCRAWGIRAALLPATDDPVPTRVITTEGELDFQEYFVHLGCRPQVSAFRFEGAAQAAPAPGVLPALCNADLVIFCPSNPWVSIDPILAIPGIRPALLQARAAGIPIACVSPILGGQAVKGPAAKMFSELGIAPSALAVAQHYQDVVSDFYLDHQDHALSPAIAGLGLKPHLTQALMKDIPDRARLAGEVCALKMAVAG